MIMNRLEMKKCSICNESGLFNCGKCGLPYCSKECQRKDWLQHKDICHEMPALIPITNDDNSCIDSFPIKQKFNQSNQRNKFNRNRYNNSDRTLSNGYKDSFNVTNYSRESNYYPRKISYPLPSNDNRNSNSCANNVQESLGSEVAINPPELWRKTFDLPRNFVKVVVQYIVTNDPTLVWVMQYCLIENCNQDLTKLNRILSGETEKCPLNINERDLVVVPYKNLLYRAIIMEKLEKTSEVRVRLIDFGNELSVPFKLLQSPLECMRSTNAYAFCIRVKDHKPKIGDSFLIRIIRKNVDDVYDVLLMNLNTTQAIRYCSIENLTKYPNIRIINFIDIKYTIAVVEDADNAAKLEALRQSVDTGDSIDGKKGEFVLGKTSRGWMRGIIIDVFENVYILSCLDYGLIEIVEKIKGISDEYAQIETQTVIADIKNFKIIAGLETGQQYLKNNLTWNIKLIGNKSFLPSDCSFLYQGSKFAVGEIKVWKGTFKEIESNDWITPFADNDIIKIISVKNQHLIYICHERDTEKNNLYKKIWSKIGSQSDILQTDNIQNDTIVLFEVGNGEYRRCRICALLVEEIILEDIDSGLEFNTTSQKLRLANNFVRSAPVYTTEVNLLYVEKAHPNEFKNNEVVEKITYYINNETLFRLKIQRAGVELYFSDDESKTINNILIEQLRISSCDAPKNDNDPVELEDIKKIPIPTGNSIEICILDNTWIKNGIITASVYDKDHIEQLETTWCDKIQNYCNSPDAIKDFEPALDQVCFALFEDNKWYRAVCLKRKTNGSYMMMFLDYGNTANLSKDKLCEFSREFMFPCAAHNCYIFDFPKNCSEESIENLRKFLYFGASIITTKVDLVEDIYCLRIDEMYQHLF